MPLTHVSCDPLPRQKAFSGAQGFRGWGKTATISGGYSQEDVPTPHRPVLSCPATLPTSIPACLWGQLFLEELTRGICRLCPQIQPKEGQFLIS